jgi:secondary thiamine-phosphate synthase enzyme
MGRHFTALETLSPKKIEPVLHSGTPQEPPSVTGRQGPRGCEMKSYTEYLWFNTRKKREFINITAELEKALTKAQIKEGLVLASAMHITAGVYINDAEDGLIADIEEWLEKLAPFRPDYRHHRSGETNGDAHLKNLLVGHQVLVPVTSGKLDLGPWQQVYYAEFDGQRRKRVLIKVLGE